MIQINGTAPNGREDRIVELTVRPGGKVAVWLHPPGSSDDAGWEAIVSLAELQAAVAKLK